MITIPRLGALAAISFGLFSAAAAAELPPPVKPVISEAFGWVVVPGAAISPDRTHTYRAIFSATSGAEKPDQLVPAVLMAGTELNALAASGLAPAQADFVIDFHGLGAVDALLDNAHYQAKYHLDNPNLKVLSELKQAGVKLYVCAQMLLGAGIPFDRLTPDVTVASDGLVVLMTFQNRGYALLPF
jgi:intracellular sulfur oxidation DsrE/DsrF family protein